MSKEKRNKTFDQIIGNKLKVRRIQLQKTQDEIEEEAYIAEKHLGRIERGEVSPYYHTIHKLSRVLDIDLNQLSKDIDAEMNNRDK